jgi:high-affinity Fe2+/Pb2+ permease
MILYSRKNIQKWRKWRKKSKIYYCLASGFLFAVVIFIGMTAIRLITESNYLKAIREAGEYSIILFVFASFFSIALWHENERKYKEWKQS